jgi:hypothetical protein
MPMKKSVRIIKKIRDEDGQWRFVSLRHAGARYVWDKRPGHYFVEWWEGKHRRRESAGITPSEAMEAHRATIDVEGCAVQLLLRLFPQMVRSNGHRGRCGRLLSPRPIHCGT